MWRCLETMRIFVAPEINSDRYGGCMMIYLPFVRWWKRKRPHGYYLYRGHLSKGLFYYLK